MSNVWQATRARPSEAAAERPPEQTASSREDGQIVLHLEPHLTRGDDDEWRLRERGVPVWAIIGSLTSSEDNIEQVARDYGVSRAAVDAARAYYHRHRALIDARLEANRTP